tara:strand:+ start:3925 stop:4569 length:645 start_codon:yes stop_codon:yes gene_type:complete
MKIVCIGYRNWANQIYKNLKKGSKHKFIIFNQKKINEKKILSYKPDFILFYGWSWIIGKNLIKTKKCIMLHPSKLPDYRGGSPIQNQILNNVLNSAVTLFRMNSKIDAGNILLQERLSLKGSINEIFERIIKIGTKLTKKLLKGDFKEKKQPKRKVKIYKRRSPEQSEITIQEIKSKSSKYLYNKIRMLADPYPNAFVKTKDNKKLIIKKAKIV